MRRGEATRTLAAMAIGLAAGRIGARRIDAAGLPAITVASLMNDTGTAALYAMHAGLFKKAGLDVQLEMMTSGAAAAAAVAGGSAQFGLSSLITILTAHDRGIPFTLVAPAGVVTPDVPYSQFVVRKASTLKTARDLAGKTLGTPALKDLDTIAIMNWVDKNGGDSTSLKFLEIPAAVAVPALQEGRIDGVDLNTPTLTRALDGGNVRVMAQVFDAIAPRFSNTAWFGTIDYTSKNPDIVTRFARAMAESSAYCNAHHADTVPLVAENAKIEEAVVAKMTRITFGDALRPNEIQPLIDVAVKYKAISQPFDARDIISPIALRA
jgi:NitT/TauT family transport system substrate-binding protein